MIDVEEKMDVCYTQQLDLAQSYINVCSVYSEMRKHEIALRYIQRAVTIMERLYEEKYPNNMGSGLDKQMFASVVATAFENAAVEYEFTEDYSSSLIYYNKAVKIARIHLGPSHPLTLTFETNFEDIKNRIKDNPSLVSRTRTIENMSHASMIANKRENGR